MANSFTYSTWGEPTITGTHVNSATGQPYGDLGFRYLYVGEFDVQWDNQFGLGLHYMHARHYAPALGRFLQPDPDGLEDSLYGYAANSPVTEMDPDGTCFIVCVVVGAVLDTAIYVATTENATLGGAAEAVARGAIESAINPLGKISKVTKVVSVASRALSKVSKATRTAARAAEHVANAAANRARATGRAVAHRLNHNSYVRIGVGPVRNSQINPKRWAPGTGPNHTQYIPRISIGSAKSPIRAHIHRLNLSEGPFGRYGWVQRPRITLPTIKLPSIRGLGRWF